ncbi:MAG TPA: cyclic nucleotide-binding domain-containing protein [Aestuariivirgaceae bacterium]|nr:cyclic nucleotide-binding domain-containing protein [Aestuariivirgaceae bacterium]
MLLKDEVDLLRKVPLFAQLEPAKLKLLAFTSTRMVFQPAQMLFRQGDQPDAAYLILSGEADVVAETPSGEVPVATVGQNAIVGEIAILCDVPRTATVRAASRLETLKIEKEHFLRLIREFPDMSIEIMRELGNRLSKTTGELSQARAELRETSR